MISRFRTIFLVPALLFVPAALAPPGSAATESTAAAQQPTCNGQPATIVGTDNNDDLVGTPGPDVIQGLGGDDTIRGAGGNDIVCSGAGAAQRNNHDAPHAPPGPGHDTVYGGPGDDMLLPGGTENIPANTRVWSFGGRGDDTIVAGPVGGRAFGQAGSDELRVNTYTAVRADLRTGDITGVALRSGGFERHRFDIRDESGTRIIGSPRRDDVEVRSPMPVRVTGGAGNDTIDGSWLRGSDITSLVAGGDGDDDLECTQPCDINGGPGDDTIDLSGGTPYADRGTARGGLGNDTLEDAKGPAYGGPGDDYVAGSGDPGSPTPLIGGPGDDVLSFEANYGDVDAISEVAGGVGNDTASFESYGDPRGLTIDLAVGSVWNRSEATQLTGIENALGSPADDILLGDGVDNVLHGGDGTDSADGRGGTDTCTAETVTNCEGRR